MLTFCSGRGNETQISKLIIENVRKYSSWYKYFCKKQPSCKKQATWYFYLITDRRLSTFHATKRSPVYQRCTQSKNTKVVYSSPFSSPIPILRHLAKYSEYVWEKWIRIYYSHIKCLALCVSNIELTSMQSTRYTWIALGKNDKFKGPRGWRLVMNLSPWRDGRPLCILHIQVFSNSLSVISTLHYTKLNLKSWIQKNKERHVVLRCDEHCVCWWFSTVWC